MENKNTLILSRAIIVCFVSVWMLIAACNGKAGLSPKEYVQWVNDPKNGLVKEKTIDQYEFMVQYRPAAYLAIQEEQQREPSEMQSFDSVYKEFSGLQYFAIRIGSAKGNQDV